MTRFLKRLRPSLSRWHALPCCVIAFALLSQGCSEKQPKDVLAKVGTREIRVADMQREAQRRRSLKRPVPDKETLLQEMIQQEALLQRAKAAGLNTDPQLVHEMENLLIGKLLERELASRIETVRVAPDEIKSYYDTNIAKYTRPAKSRLAILFLEAGAKSSETTRAEARARLGEARAKYLQDPGAARANSPVPGFGMMAVDFSDDQASRYRSGDIGWIEPGQAGYRWPKLVLETGHALENGRISDVIETETGYYLVMKTDSVPGSVTPFERVEADLRQSVLLKKRRELDSAFRAEAIRIAGSTVFTNALRVAAVTNPAPALASNSATRTHSAASSNASSRGLNVENQKVNSL